MSISALDNRNINYARSAAPRCHSQGPISGLPAHSPSPSLSSSIGPISIPHIVISHLKKADYPYNWGKYQIVRPLAQGGMGKTFIATYIEQTEDGKDIVRECVLKIPSKARERDLIDFKREATVSAFASSQGDNINIVKVIEFGEIESIPYIAMEYIQGNDLRQLLYDQEKLSVEEAIGLVLKICEGLTYLHILGIVHKDLKPENIMLEEQGRIVIIDLGTAIKFDDSDSSRGTPGYAAPEQINGGKIDQRADIFSLGVILFELLYGNNPFDAYNSELIDFKVLSTDPPMRWLPGNVPQEMRELIAKMIAKNPEARCQSCDEVAAELKKILVSA